MTSKWVQSLSLSRLFYVIFKLYISQQIDTRVHFELFTFIFQAVVLEGKYWKRKLAAVTAEYKKWRLFYKHNSSGHAAKDSVETVTACERFHRSLCNLGNSFQLGDIDLLVWDSNSSDNMHMMVDEDYMGLMSDTLFSTISNQPFPFPDSREIGKYRKIELNVNT